MAAMPGPASVLLVPKVFMEDSHVRLSVDQSIQKDATVQSQQVASYKHLLREVCIANTYEYLST